MYDNSLFITKIGRFLLKLMKQGLAPWSTEQLGWSHLNLSVCTLDSFPSACSDLTIFIINTISAVSYCTLKWFQLQTNKIHKFIGRSCVQVAATKRCFLIIEWYRRMDRSCQVKHYKIEHSCTVVCWLDSRAVGREPVFRQVPRHLWNL